MAYSDLFRLTSSVVNGNVEEWNVLGMKCGGMKDGEWTVRTPLKGYVAELLCGQYLGSQIRISDKDLISFHYADHLLGLIKWIF